MSQIDNKMYYGAKPSTFEKAKALRNRMTEAEELLWAELNNSQLGIRFKAQHPIDIFIVDFYCHKAKLVVELDGEVHLSPEQKEWDENRIAVLNEFELKVIRFTNEEVFSDRKNVIKTIMREIIASLSNILRKANIES